MQTAVENITIPNQNQEEFHKIKKHWTSWMKLTHLRDDSIQIQLMKIIPHMTIWWNSKADSSANRMELQLFNHFTSKQNLFWWNLQATFVTNKYFQLILKSWQLITITEWNFSCSIISTQIHGTLSMKFTGHIHNTTYLNADCSWK